MAATIIPRNLNQREYLKLLDLNLLPIVLTIGQKSVGKKFLTLSEGFHQLKNNKFEKLVVTYPHKNAEHEYNDEKRLKTIEYLKQFDSSLLKNIGANRVIVDKIPTIFGKNLSDSFVVGLNMSDSTTTEMCLFLNNYGKNSKFIATGDTKEMFSYNGLTDIIYKVKENQHLNYIKNFDFDKSSDEVMMYGVNFELFKLYSESFKKLNRFNIKYDEM